MMQTANPTKFHHLDFQNWLKSQTERLTLFSMLRTGTLQAVFWIAISWISQNHYASCGGCAAGGTPVHLWALHGSIIDGNTVARVKNSLLGNCVVRVAADSQLNLKMRCDNLHEPQIRSNSKHFWAIGPVVEKDLSRFGCGSQPYALPAVNTSNNRTKSRLYLV